MGVGAVIGTGWADRRLCPNCRHLVYDVGNGRLLVIRDISSPSKMALTGVTANPAYTSLATSRGQISFDLRVRFGANSCRSVEAPACCRPAGCSRYA